MIALLMKLGLSGRVAKLIAYVAVPLLILAIAYMLLDAYGDSRYREGKANEKAAWEQAEAEFLKKAGEAEKKADKQAAAREADHLAAVAEERATIAATEQDGSSPFDVLFGEANQ